MLSLDTLNAASHADFTAALEGVYGKAPWIAGQAWTKRPFRSLAQLKRALVEVVRDSEAETQEALLRAQATATAVPAAADDDDAAPAAVAAGQGVPGAGADPAEAADTARAAEPAVAADPASAAPAAEPSADTAAAAQRRGAAAEQAQLALLRADHEAKFGFPFVLAAGGPRGLGLSDAQIATVLRRRLGSAPEQELAEGLRQLHRMAELRLSERFGQAPEIGNRVWDWAERLAAHSDPGFAEQGRLTVTYLSAAHRACAAQLAQWMQDECGFDSVAIDAVGNVVAVYEGSDADAPRLLTGSHYDTVRDGGRYDGRLGILLPMACVRELQRAGRRLPFGVELVAFAEEEGQRFAAGYLGSSALTGHFDRAWLDLADADGVTMREAMQGAGLRIADIPQLQRDPARYLGFVEVHIEQGPVLFEADLPLGDRKSTRLNSSHQ